MCPRNIFVLKTFNYISMKNNVIKTKSFAFSVQIVKLCLKLRENQREFILSMQLMRSGTTIGALIREAEHAENKADFIHKFAIAQKEANETVYWLDLLFNTDFIAKDAYACYNKEAVEILKIITSIIKTSKANR